ncbi:MAG: O-antigen ligase family protein [Muribaculum sp.]|nr:O-antigen ligase family protein [Muribaculum sp.]
MSSKSILNFYLLLWCVFDVTFSARIMISRPIFVVLFVFTIYYGIKSLRFSNTPPYIKGLLVMLGMFFVYGGISIINGDHFTIKTIGKKIDSTIYLISIFKSLAPILPFYYFTRRGVLTDKTINIWVPLFIISSVCTYYYSMRMLLEMGHNADTLVVNGGYSFVAIIPLLYFIRNRNLGWIYLTIIVIFSLLSVKRGAILISLLSAILFIKAEVKSVSSNKKAIIGLAAIVFLGILSYIVYRLYSENIFLQSRIESMLEGNSSHRDTIYENLLSYWSDKENIIQQIFGLGASATLNIGENYAHNDWLEILINNGLIGIGIFIYYWISMYRQANIFSKKSRYHNACMLLLFIGSFKTIFSMYYTSIITPMAMCLGYVAGQRTTENEKYISHI